MRANHSPQKMTSTLGLALLVCVSLPTVALSHPNGVDQVLRHIGGSGSRILAKCSKPTLTCLLDSQCREAVLCNVKCQGKTDEEACNLLCELTYGYNSTKYRNLMQCMSDHGCLPKSPPDGTCLANDTDAINNFTDMAQAKGKWWILRGLNCGQPGRPAGFDYFPCQRDEFVFENSWSILYSQLVFRKQTISACHRQLYTPLIIAGHRWKVLEHYLPVMAGFIMRARAFTPTSFYARGSQVMSKYIRERFRFRFRHPRTKSSVLSPTDKTNRKYR